MWAQPQAPYPLDGIGFLRGDIYDLQGRFNINGLVEVVNQARDPNTPLGAAPTDVGERDGETQPLNAKQPVLLRLLLSIEEAELSRAEATR